jgi:hypothetical protein
MDVSNRINDLIVISTGLADLLTRENEALREQRPKEVAELLDDKTILCKAYETRLRGLADEDQDEALAEVDPDLRERLRGLCEKVMGLTEENARLLKIGMEANRRVVKSVAEAVKTSRPSANTYSASGSATNNGGGNAAHQNVPISVDRSL